MAIAKSYLMLVAVIGLVVSHVNTAQAEQTQCQKTFEAWKSKFAAGSPYSALNKVTPKKLEASKIDQLLRGDYSMLSEVSEVYRQALELLKQCQLKENDASAFNTQLPKIKALIDDVITVYRPNQDARSLHISNEIGTLINETRKNNQQKPNGKQLLIVFAGSDHVKDYFLTEHDTKAYYAHWPINPESKKYSDDFRNFFKKLPIAELEKQASPFRHMLSEIDGRINSPNFKKLSKKKKAELLSNRGMALSALKIVSDSIKKIQDMNEGAEKIDYDKFIGDEYQKIAAYRKLFDPKSGHALITSQEIWAPLPPASDEIMMADFHGINETSLADELPSGQCLKELGYDSVLLALEGMNESDAITHDLVEKNLLHAFRGIQGFANSPELQEAVNEGKVEMYPELSALMRKVGSYEPVIKVRYFGLEDPKLPSGL